MANAVVNVPSKLLLQQILEASDTSTKSNYSDIVKHENIVKVEHEVRECLVCSNRTDEYCDIYYTETSCSRTTLYVFLCKFTHVDLEEKAGFSKFMCKCCFDLINILDQAEVEYTKLKENFESIISKNPLFEVKSNHFDNKTVIKNEDEDCEEFEQCNVRTEDSEDEPLSITKTKRRHKQDKRKKKLPSENKRKAKTKSRK